MQGFTWIGSSPWLYPALEVVHLFGVALLVGNLVAFCLAHRCPPRAVRRQQQRLQDFQRELERDGVPRHWPREMPR